MNRKAIAGLVVLMCLSPFGGAAAESIARLRSESAFKVRLYDEWTEKEGFWGFRKDVPRSKVEIKIERLTGSGSGFVVEHDSGPLLVTAAHVLQLHVRPGHAAGRDLDGKNASITQRQLTCIVGPLAFSPSEVGTVTINPASGLPVSLDIALLRFSSAEALQPYQRYRLANRPPRVGERVTAIGLPSTQFPQPTESTVTYVQEDANFFVLSSELPPGYSGGVVIDERGRALGVVTGQSKQQTTVLRISSAHLRAARFQPFSAMSDWHSYPIPAK